MKDGTETATAEEIGGRLAALVETSEAGKDVGDEIDACISALMKAECNSTADSVTFTVIARLTLDQIANNPQFDVNTARLLASSGRELLDRALSYLSGELEEPESPETVTGSGTVH